MTIVIILVNTRDRGIANMRVSKEQAAKNRERILEAASRLMRERGISGVGVDALADAAGMTHGSLYSQFGSKERLVEEAVAYAISAKAQEVPEGFALKDYVSEYLSPAQRDEPSVAQPVPGRAKNVVRQLGIVHGAGEHECPDQRGHGGQRSFLALPRF